MNTQEILTLAYQSAGEPTDLCPFTDPSDPTTFTLSTREAQDLLRIANMALRRIANWRFRSGRILRHRNLYSQMYFVAKGPVTGTVVSATDTTVRLEALGSDVEDELNGWLIEITDGTGAGQLRLIVDTTLAGAQPVAEVSEAWDTNPDATSEYALYKSFFKFVPAATPGTYLDYEIGLDPINTLVDVIRIRDIVDSTDLDRSQKEEFFSSSLTTKGTPTTFKVLGDRIAFDAAPDTRRTYEIFYVRNPAMLTTATQEPELPYMYHEAVILWMVHYIQRLNQGFEVAAQTAAELNNLMETLRLQSMSEHEFEQGSLLIYG